jgi:hypothetical protein
MFHTWYQNNVHLTWCTWQLFLRCKCLYVNLYATSYPIKVKLSLYRAWRPLGLREVEALTFSDIRLTDCGKVVSPTRRPLLPPGNFLVLIFVRDWVDPRAIVRLERLGKLKKFTSSGTWTGDLPACSIVPQPTRLPRAPLYIPFMN